MAAPRPSLAFLMASAVLAAGCLGSGDPSTGPVITTAPPPEPTEGLGSVTGLVLTLDEAPIVRAEVALLRTDHTQLTDAAGRFTLNGVDPNTYTLVTNRLGYNAVLQEIIVVAGETTEVTIKLEEIAIPKTVEIDELVEAGFIECSWNPYYFVNPCQGVLGENKDRFAITVDAARNLSQVLLEIAWEPGSPATGQQLELDFCAAQEEDETTDLSGCAAEHATDGYYRYATGRSPVRLLATATDMPLANVRNYEAYVGAGYPFENTTGDPNVMPAVQQQFTLYVSVCYWAECPQGHTLLPPE